MEEYISKLLDKMPDDMEDMANTPGPNHLFNVNKGRAILFHHIVAKLLYLHRRAQQDIQMVLEFLCTRARNLDKDNYKKLMRVIQYFRDTQKMTLISEPSDNPQWWVDCSYYIHPDMKSHIGIFKSIGKGRTYKSSCKQKLNTKSPTKAKLVAIDEAMAQILSTIIFLAAQVIPVPVTMINQDNKSTSLLLYHGRMSSSKFNKHLNVQYIFVMDRIKQGEVKVTYCPNENMLADFLIRPLQGMAY